MNLIEDINIPTLSLHIYIGRILTSRVCINVLFDIYHISYGEVDYPCNNMHIY